jgi:hypothetical protein
MNIASFALTATVVAVLGCAQPASAQSQDQTGATNRTGPGTAMNGAMMNRGAMMNDEDHGNATTGTANDERSGNDHDDDDNTAANRGDDRNPGRRWSGNWHMHMGMGPMGWQRPMMRAPGGAQFHFARGNSRIDVRCSVREDTRACVQAATKLLDAIAQLRNGDHADRSGAANGGDNGETNGSAVNPNGRRDEDAPSAPGERM